MNKACQCKSRVGVRCRICMHTYIHTYLYIYIYIHIYYIYIYIYIYVNIYICIYTYIYIIIQINKYIARAYMWMNMCVYRCTCVWICMCTDFFFPVLSAVTLPPWPRRCRCNDYRVYIYTFLKIINSLYVRKWQGGFVRRQLWATCWLYLIKP